MAEKKRKSTKQTKKKNSGAVEHGIEAWGVFVILLGLLLLLSLIFKPSSVFTKYVGNGVMGLFGIAAYLVAVLLLPLGVCIIMRKNLFRNGFKVFMIALLVWSVAGLTHMIFSFFSDVTLGTASDAVGFADAVAQGFEAGTVHVGLGALAALYIYPMTKLVSDVGAVLIFAAVLILSVVVLFNLSLRSAAERVEKQVKKNNAKLRAKHEENIRARQKKREHRYDFDIIGDGGEVTAAAEPARGSHRRTMRKIEEDDGLTGPEPKRMPLHKAGQREQSEGVAPDGFEVTAVNGSATVLHRTVPPAETAPKAKPVKHPPVTVTQGDDVRLFDRGDGFDFTVDDETDADDTIVFDATSDLAALISSGKKTSAEPAEDLTADPVEDSAAEPVPEPEEDVITLPDEQEKKVQTEMYITPSFELLNAPKPAAKGTGLDHAEQIERMESTLKSFGITAWVENITVGPAITRYELSIERGTRVNKILNLSDDIALSMAATGVRIEAPIPGKSAIGIEIPNKEISMVTLREVLESEAFASHRSPVAVGLGKDITGTAVIADLSKMPHLLIAGQTGSGKSVCINSIITSLIYKSSPKDVKMILVDPKMVELNMYNGIPHLMTPVVTDPKKAAGALQFVVREMDKRYNTFSKEKVKDIVRFNEVASERGLEPMYRIVVIVDELNDLMMVARGEVEDSVTRIAQLARAAGIYLILATQRPSVNVITGIIKANIPSRIAFAVSSGVDSKTILDAQGAEKLVGKGDMLFHMNGESKPTRVQGAFVGEQEIEKVVEFVKTSNKEAQFISEEQLIMRELKPTHGGTGENPNDEDTSDGDDDLFPAAVEYAIECGSISISSLQRRFKVGYARAGRLIDSMELRNIVEPSQGAKPRKVLMTREQFWAMYDERLD